MVEHSTARVLVVCETHWDRKQLQACWPSWGERIELVYADPCDVDCPSDFDPVAFVERAAAGAWGRIDGVLSSSDYPGATVAAAVAARLGLPGPAPERVIGASHKWYSRSVQREAAPDAVPRFGLIDPRRLDRLPELPFPWFVKPVKGAFSVLARRVDDAASVRAHLESPAARAFRDEYMQVFNRLLASFTSFDVSGDCFIAEEVLSGQLVTLEGFVCEGAVEFLGIVDSTLHPGTGSFVRFDYPSRLDALVQVRMQDIARRVVKRLGLERSLFNIEMIWDPETDRVSIIEVNPRICGQFADLYQKVDGISGYEIALALSLGEQPALFSGQGRHACAASVPLRVFERCTVERAPGASDIASAETLFSDTLIWSEARAGDTLADFEADEDGQSHRYAVLNVGAPDPATLDARIHAVEARLGFAFREPPEAR